MDTILFLFIFPIVTIIFSIALQKLFCNPPLVSAIIFSIFLIVTFTVYGVEFLIATVIYALIAFVTAYIVSVFCKIANRTIEINFIDDSGQENEKCDDNIIDANRCNIATCRTCNCQRQCRNCLRKV